MKYSIHLDAGALCSVIAALLMERGLTEYTLPLAKFEELNLDSYCVKTHGTFDSEGEEPEDGETPVSITITVRRVDDLSPIERFAMRE